MSEERPEMKKRRDLRRRLLALIFGILALSSHARFSLAQVTGGGIVGTITDQSGATVGQTHITVRNLATGFDRTLNASEDGSYSVAALPAGKYEVKAEAQGFRSMTLQATVEVGTTTTVNLTMELGSVSEVVDVVADATPQMKYEQHEVGGVVTRDQIQSLPLNGRNFLDLARLEPGVTGPERNTNNRTNTPLLGAPRNGTNTLVTIDGGSVMLAFSRGSVMNFSQEGVQEFQIGTVNLDLSTGPTTTGNVNIVTRSGGNDFHGSGFYFFRGHQLAAYPGLARDPKNPDPFFQRQQFGYDAGGPLLRDKAFFFVNTERNDQRSVVSVQPRTAEFAPLGGLFASPHRGTQFSARFDLRMTANENAFVRYSHDGNTQFAPNGSSTTALLPSSWSRLPNWVDQSGIALNSSLSPTLVNDVRFFYLFISTPEQPPDSGDCPGTCVGRGAPGIDIPGAGLSLGFSRRVSLVERNYQLSENLTWQKGSHRLRFGAEFQRDRYSGLGITAEPAQLNLYAPSEVRQYNASHPADAQIPLPSSVLTTEDILSLPLRSFMTGIGNGHEAYPGFRKFRSFEMYRWYAGDVWRLFPSLTVNYGLSWAYEPHDLNYDLSKPQLLQPLLGQAGLRPPGASAKNFSPKIGFAWTVTSDAKTVVRAGAGLYYDPLVGNISYQSNERKALGPAGTGRSSIPGSRIFLDNGVPLDFQTQPTSFTAAQLLSLLPNIRARLLADRNPGNQDSTIRNIDVDKVGQNISDPFFTTPYALHVSAGVQRQLTRDLVVTADFVYRRFVHVFIPGIDYNLYRNIQGVQSARIPLCSPAQSGDVHAACSGGAITFDNTTGLGRYTGLLARVEKRFSRRFQFLGSYALATNTGTNGTVLQSGRGIGFNSLNWFENYGPVARDLRHVASLSGFVDLPKQFQIALNGYFSSRPPFSVWVSGMDFNGDGLVDDLLPGTKVNQFGRGLDREDLTNIVDRYNQQFAGKKTLGGQTAPSFKLPADYSFGKGVFTQDLRLSRSFPIRERGRFVLFGEVFNMFNIANLVGYSGNLANTAVFGQPSSRFDQVFGSGGPRTFQLGARISF